MNDSFFFKELFMTVWKNNCGKNNSLGDVSVMTHDKMLLLKFMIQGTKKFKSYEDFDVKTSVVPSLLVLTHKTK